MPGQLERRTRGRLLEERFSAVKSIVHLALQEELGDSLACPRSLYHSVVNQDLGQGIHYDPAHQGERHEAYSPLNGVRRHRNE
jgi:hypothetical protein